MKSLKRSAIAVLIAFLLLGGAPSTHAQDGELHVAILGVHDDAFPIVTAHLSVMDERGFPITGVTTDDVEITEQDGAGTSPLAVEVDGAQPIALAIAIDTSTDEEQLSAAQDAVRILLGALNDQDRTALVAFGDEAQVVRDFGEPAQTSAALDSLAVAGRTTALHNAILEALGLCARADLPRCAIVVLTDRADNRAAVPLSQVIEQVTQQRVPTHIVAYGPQLSASGLQELRAIADAAAGRVTQVTGAGEIASPLNALWALLRQGYRVDFCSALTVDDRAHGFALTLRRGTLQAETTGSYTARRRALEVHLEGVQDGQTVTGIVSLTAHVASPAPVVRVEYWVDGDRLAGVSDAPYQFAWNALAAGEGPHTIAAKAFDDAGNEGAVEVSATVVAPVAIALQRTPDHVSHDGQATVEAHVEALAGVAQVEFLLDGRLLESEPAGPGDARYEARLDAASHGPGEHILAVRAQDLAGRWAEVTHVVVVDPPPTPTPTPVPTPVPTPKPPARQQTVVGDAIALGTAIVCAIIAVFLGLSIARRQRRQQRRTLQVEIENQGNVSGRFELRAEEPEGALDLRWQHAGEPLPHQAIDRPGAATSPDAAPARAGQEASAQRGASPLAQARTTGRRVMGFGSTIASLLDAVSQLLPRDRRGGLQQISASLRRGRAQVQRVTRVPARAGRFRTLFRRQAVRKPDHKAKRAPDHQAPPIQSPWSLTPPIAAGGALTVELIADPVRPFREQRPRFRVLSRSAEREDAPVVVDEQVLLIPGMPVARRLLPFALLLLGAAAVPLVVLWLVRTLP